MMDPLFFGQCGEWLFHQDARCRFLYWGLDQYGIEFQSDMEECLFGDSQLCTSIDIRELCFVKTLL